MIVAFLLGCAVTLSIVNLIEEHRLRKNQNELDILKHEYSIKLNAELDKIDREYEARKFNFNPKYAVNPVDILKSKR